MALSREQVDHIALLSRLELNEAMRARMTETLGEVLDYVAKLDELDTAAVEPMARPTHLLSVLREDAPAPSLPREDSLANAPDQAEGFFRVPKVLE